MVFFKCHYCTAYVLYGCSYDVKPLKMCITCVVHESTRRLQRESSWCCSVILSADVKVFVLPWFQPGISYWMVLACKSPRLRFRRSPRFVAPMLWSILSNYSMNGVWSDFPEISANAEERLLLVAAQFDLFSRHLFLSSEVVADSVFSEGERFQFQCRCPLVRVLFCRCFVLRDRLRYVIK